MSALLRSHVGFGGDQATLAGGFQGGGSVALQLVLGTLQGRHRLFSSRV